MAEPPFPEAPRVVYERNPLSEVICQLRFPPILKVQASSPAAFQDRIRNLFPEFEQEQHSPLGSFLPPELVQAGLSLPEVSLVHRFLSDDRSSWSATLANDFLAVATRAYRKWEEFEVRAVPPIGALEDIYVPAFYRRVGLRYRDVIKRQQLELKGVAWVELLRPVVLGAMGAPEMAGQNIEEHSSRLRFRWADKEAALLQFGLEQIEGESCFVVDFDFYCDKRLERGAALAVLQRFNRLAGRAFRWCITDRLHEALGPKEVPKQ